MTIFGVDYSTSRPGAAALRTAGYTFACRYLAAAPGSDIPEKVLTRAEADGLRAGGIDVVSNWEVAAGAPLSGRAQGVKDAQAAAAAHARFGGPSGRPIYFSHDKDPRTLSAAQWAQVEAYYAGVASVIGLARTGAYGGYALIKHLFDKGLIRWGWQTYAWSAGQWDARAQLRQVQNGIKVAGQDCDRNQAMTSDFGQWGTTTEGNDMDPNGQDIVKGVSNAQALTDIWSMVVQGRPGGDATVTRFKAPNGWTAITAILTAIAAKVDIDPSELAAIQQAAQAGTAAALTAALGQMEAAVSAAVEAALPEDIAQAARDGVMSAIHDAAAGIVTATTV